MFYMQWVDTRIPKVIRRYKHIDRILRVCNVCAENKVGDEYHVLFECSQVDIAKCRYDLLPKYYVTVRQCLKLYFIVAK